MRYQKYHNNPDIDSVNIMARCTYEDTFGEYLEKITYNVTDNVHIILHKTLVLAVQKNIMHMDVDTTYNQFKDHLKKKLAIKEDQDLLKFVNIAAIINLRQVSSDFDFLDDYAKKFSDYGTTHIVFGHEFYRNFLYIARNFDVEPVGLVNYIISDFKKIFQYIKQNFYKYKPGILENYLQVNGKFFDSLKLNIPSAMFNDYFDVLDEYYILMNILHDIYKDILSKYNSTIVNDDALIAERDKYVNELREEINREYGEKPKLDDFLELLSSNDILGSSPTKTSIKYNTLPGSDYNYVNELYDIFNVITQEELYEIEDCEMDDDKYEIYVDSGMKFIRPILTSGKISELFYVINAEITSKNPDKKYTLIGSREIGEHVLHMPKYILLLNKSIEYEVTINNVDYYYRSETPPLYFLGTKPTQDF